MSNFRPTMPLHEARETLRTLVDDGHRCPCCNQMAKVYRRQIHSSMTRALIDLYRAAGTDWAFLPDVVSDLNGHADFSKLRYWGLVEQADHERADGSKRNGWWRITPDGESFVTGGHHVPKYARVYDGRCLGLAGELVGVADTLGNKFDYAELMGLAV